MQLSKITPKPTTRVELDCAPGLFVVLASLDTPEVKAVQRKAQQRRLEARQRGGVVKPVTLEELDAETLEVLKVAVVGIEDQTGDGEPMAYTPENVAGILAIGPVFRQLEKALGNDALFFGA